MTAIPKEFKADHRFRINYTKEGKCPKCNHRLFHEKQVAACPPCDRCPSCGYHRFDQHMNHVDFDMLQTMGM
jgi:predicted nucleic-acid-binding Zn-ribbon protein